MVFLTIQVRDANRVVEIRRCDNGFWPASAKDLDHTLHGPQKVIESDDETGFTNLNHTAPSFTCM